MYGYGDQPEIIVHNFANENLQDKKILLIRDSMLDTAKASIPDGLPEDIRAAYDNSHTQSSENK